MKEDKIIQSASALFTDYGYKKVTMDDIARNAGVTKKTVYSYFKDKNELLDYIIHERIYKMKAIINNVKSEQLSFVESIHRTIYELFKFRKEDKFLGIITREVEVFNNPSLRESMQLIDQSIKEFIKDRLIFARENNFIKDYDIDVLTVLIYKMHIALMYEWDHERQPLDEKKFSDTIITILTTGLFREVNEYGQ